MGTALQILNNCSDDPRFASIIAAALDPVGSAIVERDPEPSVLLGASRSHAKLHAFRKQSGYYKDGAVIGLDESIVALSERDVPVRLGVVETDRGHVGLWLDERDCLLGVMVFGRAS